MRISLRDLLIIKIEESKNYSYCYDYHGKAPRICSLWWHMDFTFYFLIDQNRARVRPVNITILLSSVSIRAREKDVMTDKVIYQIFQKVTILPLTIVASSRI